MHRSIANEDTYIIKSKRKPCTDNSLTWSKMCRKLRGDGWPGATCRGEYSVKYTLEADTSSSSRDRACPGKPNENTLSIISANSLLTLEFLPDPVLFFHQFFFMKLH